MLEGDPLKRSHHFWIKKGQILESRRPAKLSKFKDAEHSTTR